MMWIHCIAKRIMKSGRGIVIAKCIYYGYTVQIPACIWNWDEEQKKQLNTNWFVLLYTGISSARKYFHRSIYGNELINWIVLWSSHWMTIPFIIPSIQRLKVKTNVKKQSNDTSIPQKLSWKLPLLDQSLSLPKYRNLARLPHTTFCQSDFQIQCRFSPSLR